MIPESFERELSRCLREHRARYPLQQAQDEVKLVFQAMLGPGHLLAAPEITENRIRLETADLEPDPEEPLTEPLGEDYCRLNLRRAMAEGLTCRMIAGMMAECAPPRFTRKDAAAVCGHLGIGKEEELKRLTDESFLPSHSQAYRAAYRPAYRVLPMDWVPVMDAVLAIAAALRGGERVLVTLDGPCAGGKTTLAGRLARVFGAAVVHTDDFVIPHAQKTPERLAVPGGNCDAERLVAEVAAPWKRGGAVLYRKYDCAADCLLPAQEMPECGALILEGCYCNLPRLSALADVRLFLATPWPVREARLRSRESAQSLERFYRLWIPLEDAYFEAYGLPDEGCILLRG
ncbi:MAG: hypothetical protein IJ573_01745 [Clostridia bacterium]|nr:hypothetical protein [Clostridia bacterium]